MELEKQFFFKNNSDFPLFASENHENDRVIGDRDLIADNFFRELSDLIGNWSPIPFWPCDRELIADRKKSDRSLLWLVQIETMKKILKSKYSRENI